MRTVRPPQRIEHVQHVTDVKADFHLRPASSRPESLPLLPAPGLLAVILADSALTCDARREISPPRGLPRGQTPA